MWILRWGYNFVRMVKVLNFRGLYLGEDNVLYQKFDRFEIPTTSTKFIK